MIRLLHRMIFIPIMVFHLTLLTLAQTRYVQPSDCVTVKYIAGMWSDKDSGQIAYLLKVPNIAQNRNEYDLYVKDTTNRTISPGRKLLSRVEISDVTWFGANRKIAFLQMRGHLRHLVFADAKTGATTEPIKTSMSISGYTINDAGTTIVFSVEDEPSQSSQISPPTPHNIEIGYRVQSAPTLSDGYRTKSVFISRLTKTGRWSPPEQLVVANPFTHHKDIHLEYARHLSLSPDGKRLFFTYLTTGIPSSWMSNPYIKDFASINSSMEVMVLYDTSSRQTKLAFDNITCYSQPIWSRDGRSFFLVTHSPVGSRWEAEDITNNQISAKDVNLFQVEADTGTVSEVFRHVPPLFDDDGPLYIGANGDVVTRTDSTSVGHFRKNGEIWELQSTTKLPNNGSDYYMFLTANATSIFGVHETITVPEDLFSYDPSRLKIQMLTNLNPEIQRLTLAQARTIQWTTENGLPVKGFLFLPPNYTPGQRYPLVIQTKGDSGWFTCDSGPNHYPSFAPQPLASAGILYLIRRFDDSWNYQEDLDKMPVGYPGQISEAVQNMNIWESAVDMLDKAGIVDTARIGIIGFSRTGFYTEFALAHSRISYAAATTADNVHFSFSEYWLFPSMWKSEEAMFGGPPHGLSLTSWETYSVSFNLDKINTPLLMEEMGNSTQATSADIFSAYLADHNEIRIGLEHLGKPVEMYYYPNEAHQLDHPLARLTSLQRNLDWYRFWLQDEKDSTPSKRAQYERWEKLRQIRDSTTEKNEGFRIISR